MLELILEFILNLVVLGLGYYLVHSIFSKNTKDFHCSVDQNRLNFDSLFYKEQVFSSSIVSLLCKKVGKRRNTSGRIKLRVFLYFIYTFLNSIKNLRSNSLNDGSKIENFIETIKLVIFQRYLLTKLLLVNVNSRIEE